MKYVFVLFVFANIALGSDNIVLKVNITECFSAKLLLKR